MSKLFTRSTNRLYLVLAASFFASLIVYIIVSFSVVLNNTKQELKVFNETSQSLTLQSLIQIETSLKLFGESLLSKGALSNPEESQFIMDAIANTNSAMVGFGLIKVDGEIVLMSGKSYQKLPNILDNKISAVGFQQALKSNQMIVGRPYFFNYFDQWVLPVRVKVNGMVNGHPVVAVMTAGISPEQKKISWAVEGVRDWQKLRVIHKSGYSLIERPFNLEMYSTPVDSLLWKKLTSFSAQSGFFYLNEGWNSQIGHFSKIERYGIVTVIAQPISTMMLSFLNRIYLVLMLAIFILLVGFIVIKKLKKGRKEHEKELVFQATHDSLTGLPNRVFLQEFLDTEIKKIQNSEKTLAVLFLDLDHFKKINDNFGHIVGDEVLKIVANRLQEASFEECLVARQGGDEFIIVKPVSDSSQLIAFIEKIIIEIKAPFELENKLLQVGTSVGVAMFPKDGQSANQLLRCADAALYKAKEEGRSTHYFYSEAINSAIKRRLNIEILLNSALENKEIFVVLQPQIEVKTEQVIGVEALVRWESKQLGFVGPDEFIPIAEDVGKVQELDRFVMEEAIKMVKRISAKLGRPLHLSVNISAKQLLDQNYPNQIKEVLLELDYPPAFLNVELTETAVLRGFKEAQVQLNKIREIGVGISMDDFGTGYSSLAYLHRLPATEIKIDRSFIMDILENSNDASLTKSIIKMGQGLNLSVVAEGVETQEQYDLIKEYGCDIVQGYFLAKPLQEEPLLAFLRNHGEANQYSNK